MIQEINEFRNYKRLSNRGTGGMLLIKDNLKQLLSCEVKLIVNPIYFFEKYFSIDILSSPYRSVYKKDKKVFLVCKVMENRNILAMMGVEIYGNLISEYDNSFFEGIANAITRVVSDCYKYTKFRDSIRFFDKVFVRRVIHNVLSKGKYIDGTIQYLTELISDLSSMTFENEHFSTGFILSRETREYSENGNLIREGEVLNLNNIFNIKTNERFNKRLWNLVDGMNSFFLFNKKFECSRIYLRDCSNSFDEQFIDSVTMANSIYGRDIVFRTFGHNQFSIMNSSKIEFINVENKWRIRNYNLISDYIKSQLCFVQLSKKDKFIQRILSLTYYCSTNNRSSIIWIPENMDKVSDLLVNESKDIIGTNLSLIDGNTWPIILRCVTSDGISIINNHGELCKFGQIADISKANISSLVGTGESATKMLTTNGIAIKISADGSVKLYTDIDKPAIQI